MPAFGVWSFFFEPHRYRVRCPPAGFRLCLLWKLHRCLPHGALMFKTEYDMRQAGAWDESRQTRTDTICPYCGVGCESGRNCSRGLRGTSRSKTWWCTVWAEWA